eukprot:scaffold11561_cov151-Cylindrotheca_fusiformis.AAC.6
MPAPNKRSSFNGGRGGGAKKTFSWILVLLVCSTVGFLLHQAVNSIEVLDTSEAQRLRQKIEEGMGRLKELQGGVSGGPQDTNVYDMEQMKTAVQNLFGDLPADSTDTQMRPTILQHLIRRKGRVSLDRHDIVLATHLSTSKFNQLLVQLKYWNGPASAAVYIKSTKDIDAFFKFVDEHESSLQQTSFHLVMERTTKLPYPFNILRQVALEAIETYYFVTMDVDLIPLPQDCHGALVSTLPSLKDTKSTLYVLPAFSLVTERNEKVASEDRLPHNRTEAIQSAKQKKLIQFQKKKSPGGHGPSRYSTWLADKNEASPYAYPITVSRAETRKYEPYVLGFKPGIPRYWEDFRGFGRNKISFLYEAYLAGYNYAVLYDSYCVHLDHPLDRHSDRVKQYNISYKVWDEWHEDYVWPRYGKMKWDA